VKMCDHIATRFFWTHPNKMFNLVAKKKIRFCTRKVFWKNRKMQGKPKKVTRFNQPIILPWLRARAVPSLTRMRACFSGVWRASFEVRGFTSALIIYVPSLHNNFQAEFDIPTFVQFIQIFQFLLWKCVICQLICSSPPTNNTIHTF
jgi:hypothetical protein